MFQKKQPGDTTPPKARKTKNFSVAINNKARTVTVSETGIRFSLKEGEGLETIDRFTQGLINAQKSDAGITFGIDIVAKTVAINLSANDRRFSPLDEVTIKSVRGYLTEIGIPVRHFMKGAYLF